MKKLVFSSVLALASVGFVAGSKLRSQDQGSQITIKDPAEYNAYQTFSTETDPKAKASAGESFLEEYPQSVVKKPVLDAMLDAYQQAANADKVLETANRLLQMDRNNLKALLYSVIKKQRCGQTSDAATCDEAVTLAQKGLQAPKPAETSDDAWKEMTSIAYPIFHSTIALDAISRKDFKLAQEEYTKALEITQDWLTSPGHVDTLPLAQAYSQPGATQDLPRAVYLYAREWDYAPPQFKAQIEPTLEYYYKKYHGGLDGLEQLKEQAKRGPLLPPGTINDMVRQAKTPAQQSHDLLVSTPDLKSLALADKETVLTLGSREDADKLWALLKDQQTQVTGVVLEANANTVKVAVNPDAKATETADFVVNMKKPLANSDFWLIQPGYEFKLAAGAPQLVATYDSYTQTPATLTTDQAAVIVLRDGEYIPEEKKRAPAHHAPARPTQ